MQQYDVTKLSLVIEIAKKDMKQTEVIIVNVLIALCVAERK